MPTYEYLCSACDHVFEVFQNMSDKPIKKCESCGKLKAKRNISGGGGFLLKGDGYHSTDYRSENYKAAAKKDQPASTNACPISNGGTPP